jgi:hypothetical protein
MLRFILSALIGLALEFIPFGWAIGAVLSYKGYM